MTQKEKEIIRELYSLHMELFQGQSQQIEITQNMHRSLELLLQTVNRSHEIVGRMLQKLGQLMEPDA